jgi:hypothetical protein
MAKIEKGIIDKFKIKTGLAPFLWIRYLDDVFFVWEHGPEKLRLY